MRRVCLILLAASSVTTLGWAQGSRSTSSASSTPRQTDSDLGPEMGFAVTRTAKGKIAEVKKGDHGTIVVIVDSQGRRGALQLNSKTRFKADKKTEYSGKKHISSDDLEVGQNVKITFVVDTGQVLEVRLIAKT
jgi:hypothetical protein